MKCANPSTGGLRGLPARRWVALLSALVIGIAILHFFDMPTVDEMRGWSSKTGRWFPLVFLGGYAFATLFPLPRTVWTVAAGILFGPAKGVLISLVALTLSACISMLAVRSFLKPWIQPHLSHPKMESINERLRRRGWPAIFGLRMVAAVPFSVLNYAAGLSSIKLAPYALATVVGSAPSTALGVLFGDALVDRSNPWILFAFAALSLAGIIALIVDCRTPLPEVKSTG